jgi:hypothetical protein
VALHKVFFIIHLPNHADCGLPPHSAERLGLAESDPSPRLLRLSRNKKH